MSSVHKNQNKASFHIIKRDSEHTLLLVALCKTLSALIHCSKSLFYDGKCLIDYFANFKSASCCEQWDPFTHTHMLFSVEVWSLSIKSSPTQSWWRSFFSVTPNTLRCFFSPIPPPCLIAGWHSLCLSGSFRQSSAKNYTAPWSKLMSWYQELKASFELCCYTRGSWKSLCKGKKDKQTVQASHRSEYGGWTHFAINRTAVASLVDRKSSLQTYTSLLKLNDAIQWL